MREGQGQISRREEGWIHISKRTPHEEATTCGSGGDEEEVSRELQGEEVKDECRYQREEEKKRGGL